MISAAIQQLVNYGLDTGLILPDDEIYIRNQLLRPEAVTSDRKAAKSPSRSACTCFATRSLSA